MYLYLKNPQFQIKIEWANTFFKRLKGLMFRSAIPPDQGVLLYPCSAVHTCFMHFPIDVVYLDENYFVLGKETLVPWRIGKQIRGTKKILETAARVTEQLGIGMQLIVGADTEVAQPLFEEKGDCNE